MNTSCIPDSFFQDFYYAPPHLISGAYKISKVLRDKDGNIEVFHTNQPYCFLVSSDNDMPLFAYGDNKVTTYTKMCEMYFEQLPTIEKRLDDLVKRRDKAIKQILKNFDDELKIIVKGK